MNEEQFIATETCCVHYKIEQSFILALQEYGLIEVNTVEDRHFIDKDNLQELEKFIHLHYELDINMPGIDAINHLLQRVKDLQAENASLKNKLRNFE